jgi:hypothetical protein
MIYTLRAAFIGMLWLTILSCSNQNKFNSNAIDLTSSRVVAHEFNLNEDYDFTAGVILSMTKVSDTEYIFMDFARRALFLLDTADHEVRQVGSQGDGPGEYRNPIHFQKTESDEIAFTDITNMSIKFIRLDGSYVNRIGHKLGGGKQFVFYNDDIFVVGGLSNNQQEYYQLTNIDKQGELKKELFPAKEEYENQIRNLGMGGITLVDNQVFFMNIIEPVIYNYNIQTSETLEISPFDLENDLFSLNDGKSLMNLDADDLRAIYKNGEIVIFQRMGKIVIDGKPFLAVTARKGNNKLAYFLDFSSFEVKYKYETSQTIIGIEDQFIYESNIESGNGIVEKVTFSINMN